MKTNGNEPDKKLEDLLKQHANKPIPEIFLKDFEKSVMTQVNQIGLPKPFFGYGYLLAIACLLCVAGIAIFYLQTYSIRQTSPESGETITLQPVEASYHLSLVEQLSLIEEVDVDAKQFLIELIGQENFLLTEFQIVQQISGMNSVRNL